MSGRILEHRPLLLHHERDSFPVKWDFGRHDVSIQQFIAALRMNYRDGRDGHNDDVLRQ